MQPSFLPGAAAGSLDSQRLPGQLHSLRCSHPKSPAGQSAFRRPMWWSIELFCFDPSQAPRRLADSNTHTLVGFAIGQAAGLKFMHYGQCHSCQADKLGIVCKGQVLKGYEMEGQTAMEVQEAPNARCSRWILRELLHIFPWPGWLQITRESSAKAAR